MTRSLLTAAAVLLIAAGAQAQTANWSLDPVHSKAGFTARHLGFAKVRGEFKKFTATTIEADIKTGKITKLEAEADAKSVDTGVQKRDDDLRSEHFFAADKFPKIKFVLKSIKWKGKAFNAVVALTMRDVTKDVKINGELLGMQKVDFGRGPQLHAGYEATGTINRKDFNLNFNGLAEGVSIVGDDVDLNLELEMFTAAPAAPGAATASAAKPNAAAAPAAAAAPIAKPGAAAAPVAASSAARPATPPATIAPAAKPAAPAAAAAKPAAAPAAAAAKPAATAPAAKPAAK